MVNAFSNWLRNLFSEGEIWLLWDTIQEKKDQFTKGKIVRWKHPATGVTIFHFGTLSSHQVGTLGSCILKRCVFFSSINALKIPQSPQLTENQCLWVKVGKF